MIYWATNLHYKLRGKFWSVAYKPAMKLFSKVWIARSYQLRRWILAGINWYSICCSVMNYLRIYEASLSNMCGWGFIPLFVSILNFLIGIFDRVFSAVWNWLVKYGIAVKIKYNKKVIVAADVWYDKSTCFTSDYFASDGLTINVSVVSTQTWCFFLWRIKWRRRGGKCVCYCVVAGYDNICEAWC